MTARRKLLIAGALVVAALAAAAYQGVRSAVVYYLTPAEFARRPDLHGARVRLAGAVQPGSVAKGDGRVQFTLADGTAAYRVEFAGPLPDLFAEGRGVLVEGRLVGGGVFQATQVISTHPTEYRERYPER
ncbi:MAG: cytochrome c maturation protein CcmE [Armatimonadota bacterium]|nr:cytochrome c maturation protein CcmE [Armatimonadota bacterium]MDR7533348.1 cytochrome c maturation protein CcmE [Armatimonadota bacterium]MDR7536468.1 cytochrome c maturation protein CcmE [Armatimonadota bacterium]